MAAISTRLLMEKRRINGPKPPEEIDPGVFLAPGMNAEEVRETLAELKLRKDDIIVVAYPKSGTTWMQQMIKLITNNGVESGTVSQSVSHFSMSVNPQHMHWA